MKYLLLCLYALIFTLFVSVTPHAQAQTLTPQEVKGCYYHRFEVNLDSIADAIELNVCLDDQNQFVIHINADKVSRSYWGSYTIDQDTIVFNVDPYFHEFQAGSRYNKKVKSGFVKVSVHDTPLGSYGILLSTLTKDSISTPYHIADFESKDSVYSQLVPALPGDQIQFTDDYGSRKTYTYTVPDKNNDFYVSRNFNNFFTTHLKAWKVAGGIAITEAGNKQEDRIDTLQYISFDGNMFTVHPQHYPIPGEYIYQLVTAIIDPPADNYSYDDSDNYSDTTAYADYYGKKDTVHYVTDYKTALKEAKDSSRYLMLYYDAKGCMDCGRHTFDEVLQAWNDPYTYYNFPATFNSQYILYVAPEKDSLRFKKLGATELPAAIILTPDEKPLYMAHGQTLDLTRPGFGGYDASSFYEKLKLHETFTYLPEKIKASGYDSAYVNLYLQALPLSGSYQNTYNTDGIVDATAPALLPIEPDTATYDAVADPYIPDSLTTVIADNNYSDYGYIYPPAPDENFYSTFTLHADTAFAQAILDSLVNKYYMRAPTDSTRAAGIVKIVYQFDDYYCPFYSSSFLTMNDTIFNPRISFQYLIKNYNTLSSHGYLSDISYSGYSVSLYELISKRVNRFITYIDTSDEEKQKALMFQKELIRHLPQLRYLEMPLYISNLVTWYDTLQHTDLQDKFVMDYLQEIGGNPTAAITKTDAIMQQLHRDNIPDAMNYDYSNNYYYYLGGNYRYNVDDNALTHYGYYKHAESLNSVAWHYYQHVTDNTNLQQALTWSQSSLVLDPENPYFLDTYAHLLYKTGRIKEAIKFQKKAVAKLDSKKLRFEIDDTQAETIRADYARMKNKTL
jgi:tetratricopeptide (TPR) repeat protein